MEAELASRPLMRFESVDPRFIRDNQAWSRRLRCAGRFGSAVAL